jgi:hypothetical protein
MILLGVNVINLLTIVKMISLLSKKLKFPFYQLKETSKKLVFCKIIYNFFFNCNSKLSLKDLSGIL